MLFLAFLTVFSLLISVHGQYGYVPCTFNKDDCTCTRNPGTNSTTFFYVKCASKDGTLLKFEESPEGKYVIEDELRIQDADLRTIPAKYFSPFGYIKDLVLLHKRLGSSERIDWHHRAFEGLTLRSLVTYWLDGLVPAPLALKNAGIKRCHIKYGTEPISLESGSLENLPDLGLFEVEGIAIERISHGAFSGLENQLDTIRIAKANFSDLPSLKFAIKDMKNLSLLYLVANKIGGEINRDTFPDIALDTLYLSQNEITHLTKDAFSGLRNIHSVYLEENHFESIDLADFANLPKLSDVKLAVNIKIKNISISGIEGFPQKSRLAIDVGGSGVETIDPKLRDLCETYPYFFFSITNSFHLKCEGLEWMSKIDCPLCVTINGCVCADMKNRTLESYLNSVDPRNRCHQAKNLGIQTKLAKL